VVDASAGRYIVGGKLSGALKLTGRQGTVTDDFGVQAARSPFGTFVGVLGLVLLLIVVAYAESLLRGLRRGRRRQNRAAVVGLVVVGAFGGLTATLWGWMLGIAGPTLVSLVVPMAVGAVAGLLAGLAARQVGNRARAQRQSKRLVMVARRRTTMIPAVSSPDGADS
jgi:serine/threonine-protein kinase